LLNAQYINQQKGCPVIHKNLSHYSRQYVGYIDQEGAKVIWINFLWSKYNDRDLSKDVIEVHDGCSYYWNIKIDITNNRAYNLDINENA
jgi:hypothetical protein